MLEQRGGADRPSKHEGGLTSLAAQYAPQVIAQ
jgi:hypothetical protein